MTTVVFNRYWICDRSGHGHGKWKYFMGDFGGDDAEASEFILQSREWWANHAESYSMEVETNVTPPVEVIQTELVNAMKALAEASELHAALTILLNKAIPNADANPES